MITKIQHNNYETGEFDEEKDRNIDETIALINDFPWQQEREHFSVGLTGASITIQGAYNDFLKIAPYYHGKFVLYLFTSDNKLFNKAFDNLADTFPLVRAFFDDAETFDTTDLKKQTTWLQHPANHFRTGNFVYALNPANMLGAAAPFLLILAFSIVPTIVALFGKTPAPVFVLVPLGFCLLIFAFALLFFNHVKASRGLVLILSKGKDQFAYGPADNPVWRNKKEVVSLITHGRQGKGGSYGPLTRVEIIFQHDSDHIDLSCLLLRHSELMNKFPGVANTKVSEWLPFIHPSASTPS